MNYLKIYESLVERGKNRLLEAYTESHHIIPRCMGGSDESDNLVDLTPEEHYLAHQLLVKIYPKNKALINAAAMMIPSRPSNKMYGWLRRKLSVRMSELQAGTGNSQYGTRWIHNVELEESKKIPVADSLPIGWNEGRIVNFNKLSNNCSVCDEKIHDRQVTCSVECKNELRRQEEERKAYRLFNDFLKSDYTSVTKYAESINSSQPRLSKLWNTHVAEYRNNRQHGISFK